MLYSHRDCIKAIEAWSIYEKNLTGNLLWEICYGDNVYDTPHNIGTLTFHLEP